MKGYKGGAKLLLELDLPTWNACYWRIGPRYPKSTASTNFRLSSCGPSEQVV